MFKLNRGFESRAGQIKDFTVDICCFSTKQTTLRNKAVVSVGLATLMVRDNDNVSVCNNMSTRRLLCQWAWLD
jgi:hypothetical protein